MLLRFNVSNFMSFNSEQEFSMYSGQVQGFSHRLISFDDVNVLKFCALYGANASGKSNFIKAIDFAKNVVIKGITNLNSEDTYCKIKEISKENSSKFEFEIKIEEEIYAYGFLVKLSSNEIQGEWLYKITKYGEELVFERNILEKSVKDNIDFKEKVNKDRFDIYAYDSLNMKNVLLLSDIVNKNIKDKDFKIFYDVYLWFKNKLTIIYPSSGMGTFNIFSSSKNFDIAKLLNYFDTGITDYKEEKSNIEELEKYIEKAELGNFLKSLKNNCNLGALKEKETIKGIIKSNISLFQFEYKDEKFDINKLLFKHGNECTKLFEFGEESEGTQKLIELLDIIQSSNEGNIFIIDELDRSFHPIMTKKFIETFFKATNSLNNQLIISTHESSIMDLDFLRKDEIWFSEKTNDFATKLFSLDEFKVNNEKKILKDYLEGRYGAIPLFKNYDSYIGKFNERD